MASPSEKLARPSERSATDCAPLDLGVTGYAECQIMGPNDCRYALPFGYAFLCCHPYLRESAPRRKAISPSCVRAYTTRPIRTE